MSSTSRFKKLWRQSSITSKSPTPLEGDRKFNEPAVFDTDNIINVSKSGTNEKPAKTVDRRTSRTKRNEVKSRSVNLGGLIGLWKGIESHDKESEKDPPPPPVKTLQNRAPSLDRKSIKQRKISIEKKADAAERKALLEKKASLKEEPLVEQSPSKEKNQPLYKDGDSKETNKHSRKTSKSSVDSTVTSLLSKTFDGRKQETKLGDGKRHWRKEETKPSVGVKHTNKEEHKQSDGRKSVQKDESKAVDARKNIQKGGLISTPQPTPPVQITDPQTPDHASLKKSTSIDEPPERAINKSLPLNDTLSSSSPDLQRNSRTGSLRRGDSIKRHSFRRRSKIESENKNLAEDFDKIFKRLSIGSELSISQADISSILEQVSQNQEREVEKQQLPGDKNTSSIEATTADKKAPVDGNKYGEKTVLNDSTNTLRKQTPVGNLIGKKTIGRTKVSNFEEAIQKERTSLEKKKPFKPNDGNNNIINKKTLPPKPEKTATVSEKSEKRHSIEASEKQQKKERQKTATQAKLEEIAVRREALRRKYLERSHSENSIALEKKERFRRQGFSEGHVKVEKDNKRLIGEHLTCEVASVTTNTLTPEITSPESHSTETDSGFSAESLLTQISNRPDTLSSSSEDQRADKKKKKLIRKGSLHASDSRTPPVRRKDRDVQKILRRLSLNIPPPTPEEIEEEMQQGQDLTEQERKKLAFEKRRRSLNKSKQNSTDDENDVGAKKENVMTSSKNKGDRNMECNEPEDLDHMITKANKSVNNNLTTLSEQKFKAMKNQTLQRSSSADEPERGRVARNVSGRDSFTKDKEQTGKFEDRKERKKVMTPPRGSLKEKRQKAFDPVRDIPIIRTKPLSETREQVMELVVNGKVDSEKENKKVEKSPRKERMLNPDHPSQRTFQKQSEWLEKMVNDAKTNEQNVPEKWRASKPGPKSTSSTTSDKKIDKESIRENIVVEPTCLPERKAWLEKLVRRNSVDKRNRLNKSMSLCNLSSLNFEDDDNDIMMSNPLPRQVSVEDISSSIDVENRGSAYMLPSALRKRRSMGNIETLDQAYNGDDNMSMLTPERHNKIDHVNNDVDNNNTNNLDPNLQEVIETIELPNIHERMMKFQQQHKQEDNQDNKPKLRRSINRRQRPKSYAGEHLSQLVYENGSFRPKDGGDTVGNMLWQNMNNINNNNNNNNNNIASSLGKVLMVDSSTTVDTNNNNNNNITNNEPIENPNLLRDRKRQNRRSLFSNQRILAEIAEMEQREQDMMTERTKAVSESEKHKDSYGRKSSEPIKEYERVGIVEEKGEKLKTYPRGLEAFLKENEVRT